MNADGSAELNVTNDQSDFFFGFPPSDLEPAWSPDGSQIVYTRFGTDIGVASADGTNKLLVHEGQFTVLSPLCCGPRCLWRRQARGHDDKHQFRQDEFWVR